MSNVLIGKTVTDLQIAADKKALRFLTDAGALVVKADGDCCSETWIEHVSLPALGFPAAVLAVEDLDLPDAREETSEYGDVVEKYGCKITTNKGEILIDYRNASNGYYGGNLSWPGDSYFNGGVYGQNISNEEWTSINGA